MLIVDTGGDPPDPASIERAVVALREGLVVAVPTDTVYGLTVDPWQPAAVARLFALKERPTSVPLPVLVMGWEQVDSLAGPLEPAAARLADRYWPGPLTLVVPRVDSFVADLGGPPSARATVGLRWPDHPVMATLCTALGPLAVTSANRHGDAPATTAAEVEQQFAASGGQEPRGRARPGSPSCSMEDAAPAPRPRWSNAMAARSSASATALSASTRWTPSRSPSARESSHDDEGSG